ncbi:MAG: hypothetical protein IJW24_00765 [Clostridia bacterium]|nr:hypothetical protein [Clostridia bacterium]
MKNKKPSLIVLSVSLGLSIAFTVLLCLGLFGVLVPSWIKEQNFNYMIAFVLVILNLVLDIVFMVVESKRKLDIPEWFRVVFFIGFFIFTNVYYYFGLYTIIYTEVLFYIYLSIVLSILSISIFFNVQKNENNQVKSSNAYAAISTFTYSTSMFLIFETIITAIKIVSNANDVENGILMFLIHSCVSIFVSLVVSLSFYSSLVRKKKFINACLIRTIKNEDIEQK